MTLDRVKFQDVVADQLPAFIKEDFPLLVDFLEQYYVSVETQGAPFDLLNNIDKYVNVEQLTGLTANAVLSEDIDTITDTISVGVACVAARGKMPIFSLWTSLQQQTTS